MKIRKILNGVLACTMALSMVSVANAAVFYNEETDMYVSTSESDGTLAFNVSVFNEDETISGTHDDIRYLENIVPTDDVNFVQDNHIASRSSVVDLNDSMYTYHVTPVNDFLCFEWENLSRVNTGLVDVVIQNVETGEVIARGTNLESGKTFKTTAEVKGIPLEIILISDDKSRSTPVIQIGSSTSKQAESHDEHEIFQQSFPQIDSRSLSLFKIGIEQTTNNIPRNLTGNEGKEMFYYDIGSSNRFLKARFNGSTSNMDTINMVLKCDNIQLGYAFNMKKNDFITTMRVSGFSKITATLSTNSSISGQANIESILSAFSNSSIFY